MVAPTYAIRQECNFLTVWVIYFPIYKIIFPEGAQKKN